MKTRGKIALGVGATLAAILASSPAYATVWDGNNIDYLDGSAGWWEIANTPLSFTGAFSDLWANGTDTAPYDDGLQVLNATETWMFDCGTADWDVAADGSGDVVLLCATETGIDLGGDGPLDVQVEFRFFDGGDNQASVRERVILTNNGSAAVTGAQVGIYTNWYQDAYSNLEYTPTLGSMIANWPLGNSGSSDILTDDDNVFVTDCPTGPVQCSPAYTPAVAYQVYSTDAAVKSVLSGGYVLGGDAENDAADDELFALYDLPEIAAGDYVEIVTMTREFFFATGVDDDETGVNALAQSNDAIAFAQSGGWNQAGAIDQVTVGIPDFTKVVNWTTTGSSSSAPELPNTGAPIASALPLTLLGASFVMAGVIAVLLRRRRAA